MFHAFRMARCKSIGVLTGGTHKAAKFIIGTIAVTGLACTSFNTPRLQNHRTSFCQKPEDIFERPKPGMTPFGHPDKTEFKYICDETAALTSSNVFNYKNHALYDTLSGNGKVEMHEYYVNEDATVAVIHFKLGDSLNGYPGIFHGGISALLFDNSFGWLYFKDASRIKNPAVTANLNINYKRPVLANSWVKMKVKFDKMDGRKAFMSASMEDISGNELANATSLFVQMKK